MRQAALLDQLEGPHHGFVPPAGSRNVYIEPGSTWENLSVESFNGRMRDELLNVEEC